MVDFQSRDTRREPDEPATGEDGSDPDETGEQATEMDDTERADTDDRAAGQDERGLAVVTVAADRPVEEDTSGGAVVAELEDAGSVVVTREVIHPSYDGVQSTVDALVGRRDVGGIVTVGGTGVEPTDVTIEAVRPMFRKELPGFGELLRRSCEGEAGSEIIRTRATAGVIDGVVCFCLPGDTDLARRGTRDIVAPEADALAALTGDPEAED